mmetsp:Transcript_58389/g.137069  ORF Transcript_58389/g.137069 Transcript_58389/m.137069 type:complete len:273 (+) Transcript_58389:2491-3309(+)
MQSVVVDDHLSVDPNMRPVVGLGEEGVLSFLLNEEHTRPHTSNLALWKTRDPHFEIAVTLIVDSQHGVGCVRLTIADGRHHRQVLSNVVELGFEARLDQHYWLNLRRSSAMSARDFLHSEPGVQPAVRQRELLFPAVALEPVGPELVDTRCQVHAAVLGPAPPISFQEQDSVDVDDGVAVADGAEGVDAALLDVDPARPRRSHVARREVRHRLSEGGGVLQVYAGRLLLLVRLEIVHRGHRRHVALEVIPARNRARREELARRARHVAGGQP